MPQVQPRKSSSVLLPLEIYLRDINATPLLSAREERELARRVEAGDAAARDEMVRANLRLVVNVARHYTGHGLSLQDLIAEGNLGLLRAVQGFDPSLNLRFSTYACYWIKQSIQRAVINAGRTIRVPAYMFNLLVRWQRASLALQEELGRPPSPEEVADSLELPAKKLHMLQSALRVYNPGPQSGQDESDWPLSEMLRDDHAQASATRLMEAEDLDQMRRRLDELDPPEAAVLRLRFGLDGEEPRTLKEVAEHLGLTRQRVRQLERRALRRLRKCLQAEAL
jgi:RNA polymerase primary sigma factor